MAKISISVYFFLFLSQFGFFLPSFFNYNYDELKFLIYGLKKFYKSDRNTFESEKTYFDIAKLNKIEKKKF